jgi:hypothetical protein
MVTLTSALASGCLSGGPPPRGRLLIKGRDAPTPIMFLPPAPGAGGGDLVRLLVGRRAANAQSLDLSVVETDLASDADMPRERLLVERLTYASNVPCSEIAGSYVCPQAVDSHGRLVVQQDPPDADPSVPFSRELLRVDPATGEQEDLGPVNHFYLSASGDRLLYTTASPELEARLRESDDSEIVLGRGDALGAYFVGDDAFFLAADATLTRVTPSGQRAVVAANVAAFAPPYPSDGGRNLIISRGSGPDQRPSSILDVATLRETFLPADIERTGIMLFSPTNRWLMLQPARSEPGVVLLDLTTAATRTLDLPGSAYGAAWRPGRDELWSQALDMYWVAQTDGSVVAHAGNLYLYNPTNDINAGGARFLSPDGRYVFKAETAAYTDNKFPVYVGLADDPDAQPTLLNPAGSGTSVYWPLPDGRLLVQAFYVETQRANLIVVDPIGTAAPRTIAETGFAWAVGSGRVLAMQRWVGEIEGPGDLSLVDVDTGATTWIGQSITPSVIVEAPGQGREPLAPGSHVAYVLVNRTASPYDGVWVAALP